MKCLSLMKLLVLNSTLLYTGITISDFLCSVFILYTFSHLFTFILPSLYLKCLSCNEYTSQLSHLPPQFDNTCLLTRVFIYLFHLLHLLLFINMVCLTSILVFEFYLVLFISFIFVPSFLLSVIILNESHILGISFEVIFLLIVLDIVMYIFMLSKFTSN